VATVREAYGFLAGHEELYVGARSAARTALVHSQATSLAYLSARVGLPGQVHEQDLIMHGQEAGAVDLPALKRACDQLSGEEFSGFFYGLTRTHVPFDVIRDADLGSAALRRYHTLVLPNIACLNTAAREAVIDHARAGGVVLGSFETGRFDEHGAPTEDEFLRTLFGVEAVEGSFIPAAAEEYLEITPAGAEIFADLDGGELVPRFRLALKVRPTSGVQALGYLMEPVGQMYASLKSRTEYPGILVHPVGRGLGVFFSGSFGESYHSLGFLEYEQILDGLLRRLPGSRPQIVTDAPSTVQMELWRKDERILLHLVNHSGDMRRPIRRIQPVPDLRIDLPGIPAARATSVRGSAVDCTKRGEGCSLRLALDSQYDILVLETG